MTLEELIYKRISESAAAERLALHNGAPAVFLMAGGGFHGKPIRNDK